MIDREKVIHELNDSLKNLNCGFVDCVGDVYAVSEETIKNIIALLKEQKAEYEKGFNDAMLGKQELMYEGIDGKWHKKDWRSGMSDVENVIKGLQCCSSGRSQNCPYFEIDDCSALLANDAAALLKEQEAVEPNLVGENTWTCGECGALLGWEEFSQFGLELIKYKYCPECGRHVKWE